MSAPTTPRLVASDPPELLVHDEPSPCPYLPSETARLPLRLPVRPLSGPELDRRLQSGDRRQGLLLYRTACPSCAACEPIRIDVERFRASRSQRRVLSRGREHIRVDIGAPVADDERVELYNRHKRLRGLNVGEHAMDMDGLQAFLVDTCCSTFELRYRLRDRLIGVAVVDRSATALSAVYCYFDPDHQSLSPGIFSILEQIQLCKRWGLRHLYLGLYIRGCGSMTYKASFHPHERLVDGQWREFVP